MGWTFDDYDNALAVDIETLLEIWRIDALKSKGKGGE